MPKLVLFESGVHELFKTMHIASTNSFRAKLIKPFENLCNFCVQLWMVYVKGETENVWSLLEHVAWLSDHAPLI